MKKQDLSISFTTLAEVSSVLGVKFEDRSSIRENQNLELLEEIQKSTTITLEPPFDESHYCLGCLDFLVYEKDSEKKFNFLEFNGTSIGGSSSIPLDYLDLILSETAQRLSSVTDKVPIILIPFFTNRNSCGGVTSKIFHERILFAEYFKTAAQSIFGDAKIAALPDIIAKQEFKTDIPTVIIGHIHDFMKCFTVIDKRLCFFDYPVSLSIQDNVCSKLYKHYECCINKDSFLSLNDIFSFSAHKATAYDWHNRFLDSQESLYDFLEPISFETANSFEELQQKVSKAVQSGEKVVIKPHASGIGRGVEFFINNESEEEIFKMVHNSVNASELYQGFLSWVFPYTITPFINAKTIKKPGHPMDKSKFEVRIMVYRDQNTLKAFPSIVKVSSHKYDELIPNRLALLNNVSISSALNIGIVNDYVLPLCNDETLDIIDLTREDIHKLCDFSTKFIHYVVKNKDKLKE